MKIIKNQSGFTGLEIILIIAVIAILAASGLYVFQHNKNAGQANKSVLATTLETPKAPTFENEKTQPVVTKNGITISSPNEGSSIKGSFNLTGKVEGHANEIIQLEIDGEVYLLPANRKTGITEGNQVVKINTNGSFNIPVDLNGNNVVAPFDESNYNKMHGVKAGTHKFYVNIPNYDQSVDGPTVNLIVQ